MFEDMTYPAIMDRMKERVASQYEDVDMREGSVVFNALAPAAMELAIAYYEMENILNESFVATASRTYLLLACQQMGMDVTQFDATYSVHKGYFNIAVPLNSRWSCDIYNFEVIEQLESENGFYTYALRSETTGSVVNGISGNLTPIDYTSNALTYSALVDVITLADDEASDETIRQSYYEYVTDSLVDGNVAQYKKWVEDYDGLGRCKVFPLWNGANTVKVSILDTLGDIPDDAMVAEFQKYLDPGTTGMGDGVAPIGAFVTVSKPTAKKITLSADVSLKTGYYSTDTIDEAVQVYLRDLGYSKSQISYLGVAAVILSVEGVDRVSNLKINSGTTDITLGAEEVPVFNKATWTVV